MIIRKPKDPPTIPPGPPKPPKRPCSRCNGSGWIPGKGGTFWKCPSCNGTGNA